jgi:hypothetical protein
VSWPTTFERRRRLVTEHTRDELEDLTLKNLPKGYYERRLDPTEHGPGTVAVWRGHQDIQDYDLAVQIARDCPEHVEWVVERLCDVTGCGEWHQPGAPCACGLVPDRFAGTDRVVIELRRIVVRPGSAAGALSVEGYRAHLLAARQNLSVLASVAEDAAQEYDSLLTDLEVKDD